MEKFEKKLSIIVPCYKVEEFLPRCLDSIVGQTLDGIEAICINDGSPDNCPGILKEYQEKHPDLIVIIDKENEGVWRGRFDAIKIARGRYIGFLDSDDWAEPEFAETLYQAAIDADADISVGGFRRIDLHTGDVTSVEMDKPREPFVVDETPGRLLELNGAPWNKIFKAELLKNMHDLSQPPKVLDDAVFHQLAFQHTHGLIVFPGGVLVNYVVRPGSITTSLRREQAESTYKAFVAVRRYYEQDGEPQNRLDALDALAFLHLGAALLFRLSSDPDCDMRVAYRENESYLDSNFSTWRHSPYINLGFARKYGGVHYRILAFRNMYKLHGIRAFLAVYRFMIDKLHIDIKW